MLRFFAFVYGVGITGTVLWILRIRQIARWNYSGHCKARVDREYRRV